MTMVIVAIMIVTIHINDMSILLLFLVLLSFVTTRGEEAWNSQSAATSSALTDMPEA